MKPFGSEVGRSPFGESSPFGKSSPFGECTPFSKLSGPMTVERKKDNERVEMDSVANRMVQARELRLKRT
jgi:hypothetical protein